MDQTVFNYITGAETEIENGNYIEAQNLYKKALQECKTNEDFAECYISRVGLYVKKGNKDQVTADLKKAADYGSADALEMLKKVGINYTPQKPSVSTASTSAEDKIPRISEARNGNAGAQTDVGLAYYNGTGVPKDYGKAFEWWQKAAEQGHKVAQSNMGNCYNRGWGIEKNLDNAHKWWQRASDQDYGMSSFNLANHYYEGIGFNKNTVKAREYFEKAVSQGYEKAKDKLKEYFGDINTSQKPSSATPSVAPAVKPAPTAVKSVSPAPPLSIDSMPVTKGKIKFPDGSIYKGEIVNGVPHGKGIMKFKDGGVINSNFVNGKPAQSGSSSQTSGSSFSILEIIKNKK